jgi:mono/diheme cytochrome c family protein
MKIFAGILIGWVLMAVLIGLVLWSGAYNFAATNPPGKMEKNLAEFALDHSIERRAPVKKNPFTRPEDVRAGFAHYKANCVACHGAPGVEESEFSQGLNPPAPDLTLPSIQETPDGELFWVVSNGIRSTGMPAFSPTHKEEEIWHIVAFLRHLPEITKEEQQVLKAGRSEEEHHHGEGGETAGKPEGQEEQKPAGEGKPGHTHPPGTTPHKD